MLTPCIIDAILMHRCSMNDACTTDIGEGRGAVLKDALKEELLLVVVRFTERFDICGIWLRLLVDRGLLSC